jgi:hypothetical protein
MKIPIRPLLAGLLCACAVASAQPEHFVNVDNPPFGPGDRQLDVTLKLIGGETTANIEVWVLYSDNASALNGAKVGASVPQGKAKLGTVNSSAEVKAAFIFPHNTFPKPNLVDRNEKKYNAGRTIHYKVIKKAGSNQYESPVISFTMPDKLTIVNFGDSYASGEGAPYSSGADWDNTEYADLCHRSGNSGQALAVKTIKTENPGLAIAFKNLACSGAEIAEGYLQSQKKKNWFGEREVLQTPVPPQLNQAADWLDRYNREELNIAMISGGGNDVGFATYVADYYVFPRNFGSDTRAQRNLEQTIDSDIPNLYAALKSAMDAMFDYDVVLVSEYPDPTRNSSGAFCGPTDLGLCWPGGDPVFNPKSEFEAIYQSFLVRINNKINQTISAFPNWNYVGGTMAASRNNGLCNCDQPYFNASMATSIFEQGDVFGIVHPNRLGHQRIFKPAYETALRNAIKKIRLKWAKEAAKQKLLAVKQSAVSKKGTRAAALQTVLQRTQKLKSSATRLVPQSAKIDDAALAKARQDAAGSKRVAVGQDNRMPDDDEE